MEGLNLSTRETLIASLPNGGVVAEIGVEWGSFSTKIIELNNPELLVLVDCWANQDETIYGNDPANNSQSFKENQYQEVVNKFKPNDSVKIYRQLSEDAAKNFDDNYFDWIHIDANHLQVTKDIEAWWSKVKSGGWITGHDYTMCGDYITVKRDVDLFVQEHNLELFVTLGDNGDIYEKNYPTWCFKKP